LHIKQENSKKYTQKHKELKTDMKLCKNVNNCCDVMQDRNFGVGDTVRIMNDEDAVRTMQKGHGGFSTQMKNVCKISFFNN